MTDSPSRGRRIGVAGLLVTALALFALAPTQLPDSYDWSEHGVSESAGQAVEGAWMARTGFITFGLGVLWLVGLRAASWRRAGTALHTGFAISMFGVAAFSSRSWDDDAPYVESEDILHSVFATVMGFCFVLGVLAVMLARRQFSSTAALPDLAAIAIPTVISLLTWTSVWGLLQRAMFVVAVAWYLREAWSPQAPSAPAPRGYGFGQRRVSRSPSPSSSPV